MSKKYTENEKFTREAEFEFFKAYEAETDKKKKVKMRNEFAIKNEELVNKFLTSKGYNFDNDDLKQACMMGLLKAVEKFDYKRGNRFSTFAHTQIRGEFSIEMGKERFIHINPTKYFLYKKIKKYISETMENYGMEPSDKEIEEIFNIKIEDYRRFLTAISVNSLDAPVRDNSDDDFYEIADLSNENEQTIFDLEGKMYVEDIFESLEQILSERTLKIIKYRMGYYGRVYTLDEIGKIYGVERERIRQIEANALNRIRNIFKNSDEELVMKLIKKR